MTAKPTTMRLADHPEPGTRRLKALGRFLRRTVKVQWRDYRKEFRRCQKRFSKDAVHQVRVASRRLLSTLGLLAAALPKETIESVERMLKKQLKAFSRLRDTHVQLLYLRKLRRKFPAARSYRRALELRERRLIKRVRRELHRTRHARLEEALGGIRSQLRDTARDPAHQHKLAAVLEAPGVAAVRVRKKYLGIRPADTRTIHGTRVAFKKFRYMMEALQPLRPDITEHQLEAMQEFQSRMGEIQDVEVLLADTNKFVQKQQLDGEEWAALRCELLRRRRALIQRFMASGGELLRFLPPSPLPSERRRMLPRRKR